jgi:hypothetical protein
VKRSGGRLPAVEALRRQESDPPATLSPGKGGALPHPPPLRTVLATFTAHGSSRPLPSLFPDYQPLRSAVSSRGPFVGRSPHLTFPSDLMQSFRWLSGGPPDPRQQPFGLGICPIRPVRTSRCLSAWRPSLPGSPTPAGDFRLPYGRPTFRTPSGLPRSARVSNDRGGCPLYRGGVGVLATGVRRPVPSRPMVKVGRLCPIPPYQPFRGLNITRLQSRVQSFTRPVSPSPGTAFGWQ